MRHLPRLTSTLAFAYGLLSTAGCTTTTSTRAATPAAPADAPAPPSRRETLAQPATIVLSGLSDAGRRLVALSEDSTQSGVQSPVALTALEVDAAFVGALPGHRALVFERWVPTAPTVPSLPSVPWAGPGPEARFAVVGADTTGRVAFAPLLRGRYLGGAAVALAGDTVVVEAVRAADARRDLLALPLAPAAAAVMLAEDATLVATSDDRAAFLQGGNLRSVRLDGSAPLSLGGGDGRDEVVPVTGLRGHRVLMTLHGAGSGAGRADVRLAALDGSMHLDFGQPGVDEQAFAMAPFGRVLFTRATARGATLVSALIDSRSERVLTPPELGATPRRMSDAGLVIVETAAGALLSVDSTTGLLRSLDRGAGIDVVVGTITADRVIYTGTGERSPSLRAARLDGGGVTVLCERPLWLPYFSALAEGGRVVFHRALTGQLEGGQSFGVNLDGSDLRAIGTEITTVDGSEGVTPFDQDFMAVTAAGHVILEAEYEGLLDPQLLLAAPGSPVARELARLPGMLFAGLIP